MYMRVRVHCIYKHFVTGCFFLLCTLGTSWSHQNQIIVIMAMAFGLKCYIIIANYMIVIQSL